MSSNEIEVNGCIDYLTAENDTFDLIAWHKYGNEFLADLIIGYNPRYADVVVFDAGTLLLLPEISVIEVEKSLPPWRQNDDSN